MNEKSTPRRYLLSIDGGGIRGIIPAVALARLEETTGKQTRDIFSFVAGTSTGAIIAAAVAAGIPAAEIVNLYLTRAPDVFTRYPWNFLKRIVAGSMYSTQKLYDLIAEELGDARKWTLNDSPIDLLITAKRVPDGMPWYFVRDNPNNSGRTGRLGLVDCTTASATAPTYFEPWTIQEAQSAQGDREQVGTLVDGGVGVTGNPIYQACVEAFEYTPDYNPKNTIAVSLGTGRFTAKRHPGWIWSWLTWILGQLLESPGEQQTQITWRQFPDLTLYRIDTELQEDIPLDDIDSRDRLHQVGNQLAQQINWQAILDGTDTTFRIGAKKTLWHQYRQP